MSGGEATTGTSAALLADSHETTLVLALLALLIVSPWIISKLYKAFNRQVTQRVAPGQRRGNAALSRMIEFTLDHASPSDVIHAVYSDVGLGTGPKLLSASTYVAETGSDGILFRFGKKMGTGWDAMLSVESSGSGVKGEYGVVEAAERDGLLWGSRQMDELENKVVAILRQRFPTVDFKVVRETQP